MSLLNIIVSLTTIAFSSCCVVEERDLDFLENDTRKNKKQMEFLYDKPDEESFRFDFDLDGDTDDKFCRSWDHYRVRFLRSGLPTPAPRP